MIVGVDGVRLVVRDLVEVAGFYRTVLGLTQVAAGDGSLVLGTDGMGFLELVGRPGAAVAGPGTAGLFHTAFLLPDREALGGWLVHAAGLGVRLDGAADHLVSEAVYLHDPEGNGIEVYADRDPASWRWEEGRVAMVNRPLDHDGLVAGAAPWTGAPTGTRVGHVHLRVGSVPDATAFMTEALGLDVTAARPGAVFASWHGYHHHLAANVWDSPGAPPRGGDEAGLAAVRLAVDGTPGQPVRDPWNTVFEFTRKRR